MLNLIIDHDRSTRRIVFTLYEAKLPGEMGRDFFVYDDVIVPAGKVVSRPQLAHCKSPLVRTFLMGLTNQGTFEVITLGLSQTTVVYGDRTDYREVVRLYSTALQAVFSIKRGDAIFVFPVNSRSAREQ